MEDIRKDVNMDGIRNLNELYDVLTARQELIRKKKDSICKEEGRSPDYITGYLIGLQYAKIMTACTEGFEL